MRANQFEVYLIAGDDDVVIQQDPSGETETDQTIIIAKEQVPLLIRWLSEAAGITE